MRESQFGQCERGEEGDSLQAVRAAESCPSGLMSARPPFILFGATVEEHMFLPSRLSCRDLWPFGRRGDECDASRQRRVWTELEPASAISISCRPLVMKMLAPDPSADNLLVICLGSLPSLRFVRSGVKRKSEESGVE